MDHQTIVARQAVRFRKRVTQRTTKQRLIDSRKLLRSIRRLAKEVRGLRQFITDIKKDYKKVSQLCCLFIAPDHHPRRFPVVSKWPQTIGLRQDPCLLHTLLIGGGAKGTGQWSTHHPLHEGKSLTHSTGLKCSIRVYVFASYCDLIRPACPSVSKSVPLYLSVISLSPNQSKQMTPDQA